MDSILLKGLLVSNQQTYCCNNPVLHSDSNGHDFFEDAWNGLCSFGQLLLDAFNESQRIQMQNAQAEHAAWQAAGQAISDGLHNIYVDATEFHFEDRSKANGTHPTYSEVTASGSPWILLPPEESVYHDNGIGKPELKYIHPDGREAVFDGDTLAIMTDPRYMATYNYVPLKKLPENPSVLDYLDVGGSYVGHFFTDVVPYWLTLNSNTRDQFEYKVTNLLD